MLTLKLTSKAPENGGLEYVGILVTSFLLDKFGGCSGALAVSFRKGNPKTNSQRPLKING